MDFCLVKSMCHICGYFHFRKQVFNFNCDLKCMLLESFQQVYNV